MILSEELPRSSASLPGYWREQNKARRVTASPPQLIASLCLPLELLVRF